MKELNDNENINESSLEDKEKNLQQKSLGMDKQTKNYYDNSNLELKEKKDLEYQNININNISSALYNFSNTLQSIHQIRLNYENTMVKALEPLIAMQKHLSIGFVQMQETVKRIAESITLLLSPELMSSLSKTDEYFRELSEAYVKAKENPDSFLNWIMNISPL